MNSRLLTLLFCLSAWLVVAPSASAYYNANAGRFMSQDPIAEDGGVNLYGFVNNDPVNNWDYLGMLKSGEQIKVKCGGLLGLFAKEAGVITVQEYRVGNGWGTVLAGNGAGLSYPSTYAVLKLKFVPLSNSCCCQNGKYRWYQTITKDTEPLNASSPIPRPDTGPPNLAPSYNLEFSDTPTIPDANMQKLWLRNPNKKVSIEVEFKLELQCEQNSKVKTLKTIKWGFWAKVDRNNQPSIGLKQ